MTVKELIAMLRTYKPDTRVVVDGYESDFDDPIVREAYMIPDKQQYATYLGKHEEVNRDPKRTNAVKCVVIHRDTTRI